MVRLAGMRVLTTRGVVVLEGISTEEASLIGRHWNAIRRYLEYGEEDELSSFRSRFVGGSTSLSSADVPMGGYELEADVEAIEWHAVRGNVTFESIYDEVI